jgi:HEAT repeat protein
MKHRARLAVAVIILTGASFAVGQQIEQPWSKRFPEVARRVSGLDEKLASKDQQTRVEVLYHLYSAQARDSKNYPPFFRALLRDPSGQVRYEAVHRLWEHHVLLSRDELPASFEVPFFGPLEWQKADQLARLRKQAENPDAPGGWAIHTLGIVGDQEAAKLANALLDSPSVFTRFSAAVALVQLGKKKEGFSALHALLDAKDDVSGFYRYRAAECLYRFGHPAGVEQLIRIYEQGVRKGYVDGPQQVLEDVTGQRFNTAAQWRRWLENGS